MVVDSWKPASGQQVPGKKVLGLLNRVVYTGCQAHWPFSRQQVPCIALVNCCCTQPSSFRETKPLHATTFYPDHSTVLPTQCSTGDHMCVWEQKDCMSQCMVFAPNEEPRQFYAKTFFWQYLLNLLKIKLCDMWCWMYDPLLTKYQKFEKMRSFLDNLLLL